jgi:hypothetical protein
MGETLKACARCKETATKAAQAGPVVGAGPVRIECVKCGRFVRWEAAPPKTRPERGAIPLPAGAPARVGPNEGLTPPVVAEELGSPQAWLYVSKRLDVEVLPNDRLWSLPALSIGNTVFYRLSAKVLVWLEAAGAALEGQVLAQQADRGQLDAYLEAMRGVWAFAERHLSAESVRAARREAPELPEAATGPK